jgi:hypothetical protein
MLVKKTLEADLVKVFSSNTDSYKKAADAFARAYTNYAAKATPTPTLLLAEKTLSAALETAYKTSRDQSTFIGHMVKALSAFWLTPPVTFAGPPAPGAVTVIAGLAALQPALQAMFTKSALVIKANKIYTSKQAATEWATVLDTFTKTVTVAGGPPAYTVKLT